MCKIEGTMYQQSYKGILRYKPVRNMECYDMKADLVIFQRDCDPKLRAKSVQDWLSEQALRVLECPTQSPGSESN